jgi:hypothetical protein
VPPCLICNQRTSAARRKLEIIIRASLHADTLRTFSVLNYLAVVKAAKKFDKYVCVQNGTESFRLAGVVARAFNLLSGAAFYRSSALAKICTEIEVIILFTYLIIFHFN